VNYGHSNLIVSRVLCSAVNMGRPALPAPALADIEARTAAVAATLPSTRKTDQARSSIILV